MLGIIFTMYNPKERKYIYQSDLDGITVNFSKNADILWFFLNKRRPTFDSAYKAPDVLKAEMISIADDIFQSEAFTNWVTKNIPLEIRSISSIAISNVHHLNIVNSFDPLPKHLLFFFKELSRNEPILFLVELTLEDPDKHHQKINVVAFRLEEVKTPNEHLLDEHSKSIFHGLTHVIHIPKKNTVGFPNQIYPLAFALLPILELKLPNPLRRFDDLDDVDFLP